MREIWKDISGYEGHYQVSNLGRIKSIKNGRKKIMSLCYDVDGYLILHFTKDGKRKNVRVHRVVAEAFIPNPNNFSQINHKDENKENNSVDNLEWCDCSYNINYGNRNAKVSESLRKNVFQVTLTGHIINEWESLTKAGASTGIDVSGICACCRGRLKTAGGYIWRYVEHMKC